MKPVIIYRFAGILGALAVILGAFGAHGLRDSVEPKMLDAWEKAVLYQFIHTLGLLILPFLDQKLSSSVINWVARCWMMGIVLFSGSIYLLVLTKMSWLGPVTPFGGVLFIAGWICLIIASFKLNKV